MDNILLIKIKQILSIIPEHEDLVNQFVVFKEYKGGDFLLKEGEPANRIFFVEKGLIRTYHLEKDKAVNSYLGADGCYYTPLEAFLKRKPSNEYIQCLEDSVISSIHFDRLEELKITIPGFELVMNSFLEHGYLCISNRLKSYQMKTAREKYEWFLQFSEPKVLQRTPLLHIASYLGIAPESLSRIRKGLVNG